MTPALWTELISAIATLAVAGAAYLRANTAKGRADTAVTALNSHVMTHVVNKKLAEPLVTEKENTMSETAPELHNPVGTQGSTLMGITPPAMQAPEVVPVAPEPAPTAPEPGPVPPPMFVTDLSEVSAEELLAELAKRLDV